VPKLPFVDLPTARQLLAVFGPVFGVTGIGPVRRGGSFGWGMGQEPTPFGIGKVSLHFLVGASEDWVRVTTGLGHDPRPEWALVRQLIGCDIDGRMRKIAFPVTSTVDRGVVTMKVADAPHEFTCYACAGHALAVWQGEDRWIEVEADGKRLPRLTLAAVSAADLARFLRSARARRRRMEKARAALPGAGMRS